MAKASQPLLASTSAEIVEYVSTVRGLADAEIARIVGKTKAFVGMVRKREVCLTTEHVVSLAEALRVRLGEFLQSVRPIEPAAAADKRRVEICDDMIGRAEHLLALIEKSRASKSPR